MTIDYKQLLKQYMELVLHHEGIDYIGEDGWRIPEYWTFTAMQTQELIKMSNEIAEEKRGRFINDRT